MPKLIELFAGSRSVSRTAELAGFTTWSTDIEAFPGIDHVANIFDLRTEDIPFVPDVIWASPPCTCFSVSSIGKHWTKDHKCKTVEAAQAVDIAIRTRQFIEFYLQLNPNLVWFVENPRGKLRKLQIFPEECLKTVCYCRYGEDRMKPTDIWTNSTTWVPRPMCYNGCDDHVAAPRGSQTGTQGMATAYEKAIIPRQLAEEILLSIEEVERCWICDNVTINKCKWHGDETLVVLCDNCIYEE